MHRPLIWWRVVVGFFAMPFMPCLAILLEVTFRAERPLWQAERALDFFPVVLFFTMPATVLFGPLLFFIYRRLGWESVLHFAAGGALAGGATPLMILLLDTALADISWPGILGFSGFGAVSAAVFRYIVYARLSPEAPRIPDSKGNP